MLPTIVSVLSVLTATAPPPYPAELPENELSMTSTRDLYWPATAPPAPTPRSDDCAAAPLTKRRPRTDSVVPLSATTMRFLWRPSSVTLPPPSITVVSFTVIAGETSMVAWLPQSNVM